MDNKSEISNATENKSRDKTLWPFLHVTINLPGWRGRYVIKLKLYLTGAGESEEPFVCLLICEEKSVDVSDFHWSQIAMARRIATRISKTARLGGCLRSTVVSIYAKWMNDGENNIMLKVQTLSKKKVVGDYPTWWN